MTAHSMTIGMIGLGRMGANMTHRLIDHGHRVIAYDSNTETVAAVVAHGADGTSSLEELVASLDRPRAVWVMVPSGDATDDTIAALGHLLAAGDTIIDGGNSHYRNAQRWSTDLLERGIDLIDAGVSGGVWGLEVGYCLMVGGRPDAVSCLEPIFVALAPEDGFAHVGPSGAGHYAKMVHNGMAELALSDPAQFGRVRGYLEDSGEGRWTVDESTARAVATPVIAASLYARFSSRAPDSYAARIIAALRNEFGGHKVFEAASSGRVQTATSGVGDAAPVGAP